MVVRAQREEKLKFTDVNFHEVGKYIAITSTKEEIAEHGLEEVIPRRTAKERGPAPGPAYWEGDLREVISA